MCLRKQAIIFTLIFQSLPLPTTNLPQTQKKKKKQELALEDFILLPTWKSVLLINYNKI